MWFVFTYEEFFPENEHPSYYISRIVQAKDEKEAWKLFADNIDRDIDYSKRNYNIVKISDSQLIGFDL